MITPDGGHHVSLSGVRKNGEPYFRDFRTRRLDMTWCFTATNVDVDSRQLFLHENGMQEAEYYRADNVGN